MGESATFLSITRTFLPRVVLQSDLWYHTSAIIGASLDTMTLPYRLETNASLMSHMTDAITSGGRKVIKQTHDCWAFWKSKAQTFNQMKYLQTFGKRLFWKAYALWLFCSFAVQKNHESIRSISIFRFKKKIGVSFIEKPTFFRRHSSLSALAGAIGAQLFCLLPACGSSWGCVSIGIGSNIVFPCLFRLSLFSRRCRFLWQKATHCCKRYGFWATSCLGSSWRHNVQHKPILMRSLWSCEEYIPAWFQGKIVLFVSSVPFAPKLFCFQTQWFAEIWN